MFKLIIGLLIANFALTIGVFWLQLWNQNTMLRNQAVANTVLLKRLDDLELAAQTVATEGVAQDKSIINANRLRQLLLLEKEAQENKINCAVDNNKQTKAVAKH